MKHGNWKSWRPLFCAALALALVPGLMPLQEAKAKTCPKRGEPMYLAEASRSPHPV